jgi:hypothetical protein
MIREEDEDNKETRTAAREAESRYCRDKMKNQPSLGIEGKAEGQGKLPTNKGGGAHNGPRKPQ